MPRRQVDGLLILDKPAGMSSNAALQRVKQLYRAGKAGHTGSLDPLATGLLPICLGQATKISGLLLEADKRYRVRASVGAATDTGDAEGAIVRRSEPEALTRPVLEAVLDRFRGDILQRPPMHSALKHGGRPLYEFARRGQTVERAERRVRIHGVDLIAFDAGGFELDVRCSKGTYIRTLVEDIAAAAGQCAHVAMLRRLEAGPFREDDMVSAASLEQAADAGLAVLDALLRPVRDGLAGWAMITVDGVQARRLAQGQAIRQTVAGTPGRIAITDERGMLLGLGEVEADGTLVPRRWMA